MSNYTLKHTKTNLYFQNGEFIAKSINEATKLNKEKAVEVQRMLNGILLSKPIELIEI